MFYFVDRILDFPNLTVKNCHFESGKITLELESVDKRSKCEKCDSSSEHINQTRQVTVRDLSILGNQVFLVFDRHQFYCENCNIYFVEKLSFIDFNRHMTERYKNFIFDKVKVSTIKQVAKEEGLTYDQVKGVFEEQFNKLPILANPKRICIDEFSHRKGRGQFATVICDVDNGILIEVIDSHKQEEIIEALKQWSLEKREAVVEVSVDMWGGFTKVIQEIFPNARIVYDRFHIMKLLNEELNKIRGKYKSELSKLNIKNIKYLLMKNGEDLTENERKLLESILKCSPRLKNAYLLKEELRKIFEMHQTPEEAKQKIEDWLVRASKFYTGFINTVKNHIDGICNYFYNRLTSGVMEGINNKIKLIKRQAYGFTNFDHLRIRLLAAFAP